MRTKPFAVFAADHLQRQRQQNLLAQRIFQQQAFALIIADLGFGSGYRKLFPASIRSQRPI